MRLLLLVTALVLSGTIVNDHGLQAQSRISVTVENFGSFDKAFDLRDGNCGNEWSISLKEWGKTTVSLCTSSAGYGKLLYRKRGDSGWTQSGLLSNGDSVKM